MSAPMKRGWPDETERFDRSPEGRVVMALGRRAFLKIMAAVPARSRYRPREIASCPLVGADRVNHVLNGSSRVSRRRVGRARGGVDLAGDPETALGPIKAKAILEKIQRKPVDTGLQRSRKRAQPEVLAGILRGEHPQTIALILAHLDQRQAASVITGMDPVCSRRKCSTASRAGQDLA